MRQLINLETVNQNNGFRVSEKYSPIRTSDALRVFENHGFSVTNYNESKPRIVEKQGFQKHIVRLASPEFNIKGLDSRPEIVIKNSYDKSCSFQLLFGLYRLVCSNGLMIGKTFQGESIIHTGNTEDKLSNAIDKFYEALPLIAEKIEQFNTIQLNKLDQRHFAYEAVKLVLDTEKCKLVDGELNRLIASIRPEDDGNSLWLTYNKVQEKLIAGGIRYFNTETGKFNKTRRIKSAFKDATINQKVWDIASQLTSQPANQGA
eukprot:GHVU01180154.1.p1 GENE.GHVU01180154.1~~GHVU01180154.1.p1  ORF type:complete len:261 (+),score=2.99 GHVU01180154.1:114-896(+)